MPRVNGAASASAQGHATMSTEVNDFTARAGSTNAQNTAAPVAMARMIQVNRGLKRLVIVSSELPFALRKASWFQRDVR